LLLPQQALTWFSHTNVQPTWFNIFTLPWSKWTLQFPTNPVAVSEAVNTYFAPSSWLYNLAYFFLVVVFTFFYSSIVINTRDVADNLKKTGAFIPGIRPGQPTVDYLNKILMRLTTAAAIFLGLLAVIPGLLQRGLNVQTIYLGSTSLLIVVGVALDTITQIEARLAMRDYRGFIKR
jgi:preprotein translocase subunit SecY